VGFVLEKVALEQISLAALRVSPAYCHSIIALDSSVVSGVYTRLI
jgi:hypothetical protein